MGFLLTLCWEQSSSENHRIRTARSCYLERKKYKQNLRRNPFWVSVYCLSPENSLHWLRVVDVQNFSLYWWMISLVCILEHATYSERTVQASHTTTGSADVFMRFPPTYAIPQSYHITFKVTINLLTRFNADKGTYPLRRTLYRAALVDCRRDVSWGTSEECSILSKSKVLLRRIVQYSGVGAA